jgi:hypothetical protein
MDNRSVGYPSPFWLNGSIPSSDSRVSPMNIGSQMKRVVQEDEAGCGIACVAMVTGKPHTRHYQLRHALQKLGIATEKRHFRSWRTMETDAIVPMNRRQDGGWHANLLGMDIEVVPKSCQEKY